LVSFDSGLAQNTGWPDFGRKLENGETQRGRIINDTRQILAEISANPARNGVAARKAKAILAATAKKFCETILAFC
jgi:hypothetical protein